jgi:hypothetical protein
MTRWHRIFAALTALSFVGLLHISTAARAQTLFLDGSESTDGGSHERQQSASLPPIVAPSENTSSTNAASSNSSAVRTTSGRGADPLGKCVHCGLFLRLSLGAVYLRESWAAKIGGPGAVYSGVGTAFETAVGGNIRRGLVVGGRWQFVAVVDPAESYSGVTYDVPKSARFLDTFSAFVDVYPRWRRGFHFGGSVGAIAASNLDAEYGAVSTSWGIAVSAQVGYEIACSSHWSVGAIAQLLTYRYWASESGVSSMSDGIVPGLAIAFTFE